MTQNLESCVSNGGAPSEIRDAIRGYVVDEFLDGDADDLTDSFPLMESGVISSMGVLSLAVFLEDSFSLDLTEVFAPTRFNTIDSMTALVLEALAQDE